MAEKKKEDAQFADNPEHTGVTKDPASTPGYFRLLLPALAGRYILRWGNSSLGELWGDVKKLFGGEAHPKPHPEAHSIISAANELGETLSEKLPAGNKTLLEDRLAALNEVMQTEKAHATIEKMAHHGLKPELLSKAVEDSALKGIKSSRLAQWQGFQNTVKKTVAEHSFDRRYDYLLGAGSLAITAFYANRVASDVMKVYGETVAYELGKDPKEVTNTDLWHSKNHLLEEMKHNFIKKNAKRLGTDAVFFAGVLSHLPKLGFLKKQAFSDLGVGVKGAQLVAEVSEKKSTIFEDLILLIDNKLNPLKGLGSPMVISDVFDLYQKYSAIHDPNETFRDALTTQNHDGRDWPQAQSIFQRITDLMNETYKYKHIGQGAGDAMEHADFALPKFLYLLGNGLMDTYKPETTLAYVEVANRYGIPAVNQLQRVLERGVPLEQALADYPPELLQSITKIKAMKPPPSEPALTTPETSIHSVAERMVLRESSPSLQSGIV